VDLKKAFDKVPREVISWAMHKLGVDVMSMYSGAKTVVRTVYGNSKSFEVERIFEHRRFIIKPTVIRDCHGGHI